MRKCCSWKKLDTTGTQPSPRQFHSAVVYGSCMYIYGGKCSKNGLRFNELFEFHCQYRHWRQIKPSNNFILKPIYGHSAVVYKDLMIIYGGFDGLDYVGTLLKFYFPNCEWSEINAFGDKPAPRCKHVAVVHEDYMYVHGGDDGRVSGDFFSFHIPTNTWKRININNFRKWRHDGFVCRNYLYLYIIDDMTVQIDLLTKKVVKTKKTQFHPPNECPRGVLVNNYYYLYQQGFERSSLQILNLTTLEWDTRYFTGECIPTSG